MPVSLTVVTERPVLSVFEKGAEGSRALNFCTSGGKHCAKTCRYHPKNKRSSQQGRCYAIRIETRWDRHELLKKMRRHERTDPAVLCRRAIGELSKLINKGKTIPWFRFSTGGSVPQPRSCTKAFKQAFRDLLDLCEANNIPVHLPVESMRKYKFYRRLVGGRCTVRMSVTSEQQFMGAQVPCSVVAGALGMSRKDRIAAAKQMAREHLEETGRRAIVCPAVAASFNGIPHAISKAKCGHCTACAKPDVDVIYPLH